MRLLIVVLCSFLVVVPLQLHSQLPIVDVHLHAAGAGDQGPPPVDICTAIEPMPVWDPSVPFGEVFMSMLKDPPCDDPVWSPLTDEELMTETLELLERRNIIGVLSGSLERVAQWRAVAPERVIPALLFNAFTDSAISPDSIRRLVSDGHLKVLGEVTNQYSGLEPDDPLMAPYWALAEELDIPVGIHVGPGPPGVIHLGFDGYRARHHSAMTIEEVLVRHPRLRVYLMHAGYPLLDDLLAVLYAHPQVYVDVGVIAFTQPRAALYRFVQGIVDAGFGNRIMFGSDQMVWPGAIERALAAMEEAPFLSESQVRDILYNNAARFLRFTEEDIARHHALGSGATR